MLGYPVHLIERDRWSGPEDGGYYIFDSVQARADFVAEQTKDRSGAVPEYYIQYEFERPLTLSDASVEKFRDHKFYAAKLFDTVQVV